MSVPLECVINLSEGRKTSLIDAIAAVAGPALLDRHTDAVHDRTVLTLAGGGEAIESSARAVAAEAVRRLDLRGHQGAHPRFGVVDVVPFVPLNGTTIDGAVGARDRFARWAGNELGLPCFLYGPERALPAVRKGAFLTLAPDTGPHDPHPTAGACAVGARWPLVAYNLWLAEGDVTTASAIAARLRSEHIRALGFAVGPHGQVSCNLVAPEIVGPAEVYDAVAAQAMVARAELVGLIPRAVLTRIPSGRWAELDLADDRTIESRLG